MNRRKKVVCIRTPNAFSKSREPTKAQHDSSNSLNGRVSFFGQEIKLNGIGTFDASPSSSRLIACVLHEALGLGLCAGLYEVPAGQAKDYKFNVYAYREGAAVVRIVFTNPKTEPSRQTVTGMSWSAFLETCLAFPVAKTCSVA